MNAHWYAVHTKTRQEDHVVRWLETKSDVVTFLPKLEIFRRYRRRRVRQVEPLFPSYLFVNMSLASDHWNAVRWAPGVKSIVGAGEGPVPVPDEVVDLLQARCQNQGVIPWETRLRPGCQVRIKDGPLAGLTGVLERRASRAERVCVLISLLRTVATVEVDVIDLEEVSL